MNTNISADPKKYSLLGISISNLDYISILKLTSDAINKNNKITIGYINQHIARYAQKNKSLQTILNSFSFNHVDGMGMELAGRLFVKNEKFSRLNWTWTDDAFRFISECEKNEWKIFFLGSDENTISKAKANVSKRFPGLKLVGYLNGFDGLNESSVKIINASGTDILWVGLGSLRQESWIINNYQKLNCNVIQSVGDLYSELAGRRLRGPKILRDLGFEWLFRLIQHPFRYFNRYVVGIPYFLFLIIKYKIKKS